MIKCSNFFRNAANENDENQTPGVKLRRNTRRRHHKGDIDLISEPIPLKFRKFGSKIKKKATSKDTKKIQILPFEILQLEEVIGSLNSVKIKLYTLSNEHLGYPCDLRSNFPFDPYTIFLKIHHANVVMAHPEGEILNGNRGKITKALFIRKNVLILAFLIKKLNIPQQI